MRLRLRTRVALSFALLSFVVAAVVSITTYTYASNYLLGQRQNAALTRAVLDSKAAGTALGAGATSSQALAQVPSVGTSVPLIRVNGVWSTTDSQLPADALPDELIDEATPNGASQRFAYDGTPYFAVAIPLGADIYVEVFPLRDLDRTLRWGAWVLVGLSLLAGMFGAIIGVTAVGRILGPVRRLGSGTRRIAGGELTTRIDLTGDPDLDPIAESFNEMAEAVQARIARERRFSANVSHELRSPLTSVLGTAELLEGHSDRLPEQEAGLVTVLVAQVRRMSQMLLDLLEISRITADEPPQWESADIAGLCKDVAIDRGLDPSVVIGDRPVVRTDARRLERIVGNLIDNAQRHGGGLVQVIVQRESDDFRILVDDAGPGIDSELRERLFEPFTRGESGGSSEGAGLGLAIAREQARALGGDVTVEQSPTGGARFAAVLPVDEGTSL
jgi:signal transduction histidine kinase